MPLEELPDAYLNWLVRLHDLREPLASAVQDEMRARAVAPSSLSSVMLKIAAADVPVARELIQTGRRSCAVRHHPDKGGNAQLMASVNATADRLLAQLEAHQA